MGSLQSFEKRDDFKMQFGRYTVSRSILVLVVYLPCSEVFQENYPGLL